MRRPMRARMTAVAAGFACAALAACGSSGAVSVSGPPAGQTTASGVPSASSAPPAESGTSSGSPSAKPKFADRLKVGDCVAQIDDRWVMDDCAKAHMFEVSGIVPNTQYPNDLAARGRLRTYTCDKAAIAYLGGPILVTNFDSMPLPAALDTAQADRIVCLVFGYNGDRTEPGIGFAHMKGHLTSAANVDKSRTCFKTMAGKELVFCNEPHEGEAVSLVWLGKPGDPPLTEATTRAMTATKCAAPVRSYLGGVTRGDVVANLTARSPSSWHLGHTYGVCIAALTKGTVNRSIRGIGTKPLTAYRG